MTNHAQEEFDSPVQISGPMTTFGDVKLFLPVIATNGNIAVIFYDIGKVGVQH